MPTQQQTEAEAQAEEMRKKNMSTPNDNEPKAGYGLPAFTPEQTAWLKSQTQPQPPQGEGATQPCHPFPPQGTFSNKEVHDTLKQKDSEIRALQAQRDSAQLAFSKLAQAHDEVLAQRDELVGDYSRDTEVLRGQVKYAEQQRDELLTALRDLHAEVEPLRYSFKQSLHNAMARARAAIARATEGANQ